MKRFFLLAAVLLLAACGTTMPDPSFREAPDGKLLVDNPHKLRMMLFRGTPGAETLLGGVPAHATNFRIQAAPGDFVLIAMPVEQYMMHRGAITNAPMPFSELVRLGDGETRVTIGPLLGAGGAIRFRNEQEFFVRVLLVERVQGSVRATNSLILSPGEKRLQTLSAVDYEIRPQVIELLPNGILKDRVLSRSVVYHSVFADETNEIVIKVESI